MRKLLLTYAALLALLSLTVAASFIPLDTWSLPVSLGIATAKTALIMAFFMQLSRASTLTRVAAAAGFLWLAILLSLSFSDYAFREPENASYHSNP
ncbi:oxidase [Proteobacteria bacterium 005FR1]|nr:oxidase [Proteobacteria bacterium 005FR1]